MPSDINPEVIIVNLVNPSFITEALVCEDLVGQELIGSDLFAQICTKRALIKLDTESWTCYAFVLQLQ